MFLVRLNCLDVLALARTNVHLSMWNLPEGPLCRLTVSCGFTSARTRIRRSFTCLICTSVTTTRPSPRRTRHHCNRRPHPSHRRSDCEDGLTKSMCYSFGSQHSGTCTRQHSCVLLLSGWIPKHVREHAMAVHAGWKMFQDTTTPHLFRKDVHLQFQCFGKLFGGRSTTGTDVAELSGRQVLTSVLRLHG